MPDAAHDELSRTLRALRKAAGLSGVRAAELASAGQVSISQASISRYERGKFIPSADDVTTLSGVYGAPAEVRRRLLQLVRDLRENTTPPARVIMLRSAGEMQKRIGRVEASSAQIGVFHPVVIVGLLQLEAYASVVFASGGDLPAEQQAKALAARMARQDLLDDVAHEFTFVMTEGALRWQMGDPALMVKQLEHVVAASERPNVRVGIVAWTTAVDIAPMHGFELYDQRAAVVGTETATAFLTNQHDVGAYVRLFADLEKVASFGDAGRAAIRRVADDYRSLL